ncbi:hypothetical protein TNCV_2221381 [Trichonephila clavipes]|nr:hypothetical protein TNCV_2221381 [Trichonephila clavipes]
MVRKMKSASNPRKNIALNTEKTISYSRTADYRIRVTKKRSSDKVEIFKTGGGTPNLLCTSLDERLAAMGALIEPLPCRFDCDYEYETAVSSGTQCDESIVAQVDENMFTLDNLPMST